MPQLAGRRLWLTGADGFVGRRLLARLGDEGADVTGTDVELDVTDPGAIAAAMRELAPDAIVHLAAQSSVAASLEQAPEAYRVNFLGARSILTAAARVAPQARVVLVGSGEVYGPAEPAAPPWDESAPLRPRSPYARTKAAADLLGAAFARGGLDVVRARPFSHTGPGQSDAFALSSFARQIAEMEAGRREPVLYVGNLDSVRDFLDVDDVVDAYLRLLDPDIPADAYNVARGRGAPIRELLDALLARSAIEPQVRVDPARVRPADASVGSAARLTAATGWQPTTPLNETLGRLLDHWRAQTRDG